VVTPLVVVLVDPTSLSATVAGSPDSVRRAPTPRYGTWPRRRRGRARAGAWFGPATTPPNGDTTTSPTYASSSRRTLSCASAQLWPPSGGP